jgi:hypothetical protein
VKPLIGLVIVVAHVVAFTLYVPSCRRPELVLEVPHELVDNDGGVLPAGLRPRVEPTGTRPGLHYVRYAVDYRGGFVRTVGVASLVGPFQDPAKPACSGRVVAGQRLLDDGAAGPGTIAGEMANNVAAELAGESYFPIGAFERVDKTSLRWAELPKHPEDLFLVGSAPHGYVRATMTLVFDRIDIPLIVALVPEPTARELRFRIVAHAELAFGNRALQWLSDKLGGDKLATRLARREIDGALITTLAPPPPFDLPGGHELTFVYCDGPPEIVDGVSGALPFAVAIGTVAGAPRILPPNRGPAPRLPLAPNGTLAIDLDLDAANALLFELWRTGYLDQRLAEAGLDRRFNSDPIVTEFLSLRISPPVLALPPVLGASGDKLQMFADARITIKDGGATTVGRVWGGLDFKLSGTTGDDRGIAVDLGALELSCERGPTTLVPCYADLVAALRDRGADFHGELTRTFTALLDDIFVDQRVGASGLSADLVIKTASATVKTAADNGSLHLELDAVLTAKH